MAQTLNELTPLEDKVSQLLSERPDQRIILLEHEGRRYWLKQAERHDNLRKRLRKGDSVQALQREAEGLRMFAKLGIPVPEVVLASESHLLLSDRGPTLEDMLCAPGFVSGTAVDAFAAAGVALGNLHASGLRHGRAKPKDLCWDGEAIAFIDLEVRQKPNPGSASAARELVNFIFRSNYVASHRGFRLERELQAFLDGYRRTGTAEHMQAANRWAARRDWWMVPLAAPVAWRAAPNRSPDFKAVAPTLRMLRSLA